jgi:hypothetical protein
MVRLARVRALHRTGWALAVCGVFAAAADGRAVAAQIADDGRVEAWTPEGIASPAFESHAAFDPLSGDFYFVRSSPSFEGWRILVSHCTLRGWSPPEPPAFADTRDGVVEADPWFTPDGRSLYFISTRGSAAKAPGDLDLWRIDRQLDGGWGTPERLPEPLNSPAREWFPRAAVDGWLYFGSNREGGLGRTDIWRARREGAGAPGSQGWRVENAGPELNTEGDEYEPLVAPDGSSMILMASDGLHRADRSAAGWAARRRLGAAINPDDSAIGAVWSPSGRTLLFSRDTKAPRSGEFFVARFGDGAEDWPPSCPAAPGRVTTPVRPADAGELWAKTQALLDAVAPGDVAVWRETLDERALLVDENDTVRTKAEMLAELRPLPPGLLGSLRVETFRAELHGDFAVTTHVDDERLDYHGQSIGTRFRMLDSWRRTAAGWRLVASQVAAVLDDPPPAAAALEDSCPYAGRYRLNGDAPEIVVRLRCEAGALVSERDGRPAASLRRESGDVFFEPGRPRSRRIFRRDAHGAVVGFVDRRDGHDLEWQRVP